MSNASMKMHSFRRVAAVTSMVLLASLFFTPTVMAQDAYGLVVVTTSVAPEEVDTVAFDVSEFDDVTEVTINGVVYQVASASGGLIYIPVADIPVDAEVVITGNVDGALAQVIVSVEAVRAEIIAAAEPTATPEPTPTATPEPVVDPVDLAIVDPVPCGGPITGVVTGGTAPYTVSIETNVATVTKTLFVAGDYSSEIPTGASGDYNYSVVDADGNSAGGSYTLPPQDCATASGTGTGSGATSGTSGNQVSATQDADPKATASAVPTEVPAQVLGARITASSSQAATTAALPALSYTGSSTMPMLLAAMAMIIVGFALRRQSNRHG